MKSKLATSLVLVSSLALPAVVSAQTQSGGFCGNLKAGGFSGIVDCAILFLDFGAIAILALSVLYTMWGAFLMATDEEKRQKGKDIVLFGIVGIFVMTSIWGLVNILDSTFRLQRGPVTPQKLDRTMFDIKNPFGN